MAAPKSTDEQMEAIAEHVRGYRWYDRERALKALRETNPKCGWSVVVYAEDEILKKFNFVEFDDAETMYQEAHTRKSRFDKTRGKHYSDSMTRVSIWLNEAGDLKIQVRTTPINTKARGTTYGREMLRTAHAEQQMYRAAGYRARRAARKNKNKEEEEEDEEEE